MVVGCVGEGGRGVYGAVVDVPGVNGGWVWVSGLLVPVIGDFVIVDDVDPWQVCSGTWPVWGGVDLAVFSSICFHICAESVGHVNVDEIALK